MWSPFLSFLGMQVQEEVFAKMTRWTKEIGGRGNKRCRKEEDDDTDDDDNHDEDNDEEVKNSLDI